MAGRKTKRQMQPVVLEAYNNKMEDLRQALKKAGRGQISTYEGVIKIIVKVLFQDQYDHENIATNKFPCKHSEGMWDFTGKIVFIIPTPTGKIEDFLLAEISCAETQDDDPLKYCLAGTEAGDEEEAVWDMINDIMNHVCQKIVASIRSLKNLS